jgi:hypothetical protein
MHLSGQLSDWSINDLLQIMQVTKKTGSLDIDGERRGRIHFRDGTVTGAELSGDQGAYVGTDRGGVADILYVLSTLENGSFAVGAADGPENDGWSVEDVMSDVDALESLEGEVIDAGLFEASGVRLVQEIDEPITISPEDWSVVVGLVHPFTFGHLEGLMGRGGAVRVFHTLHRLGVAETIDSEDDESGWLDRLAEGIAPEPVRAEPAETSEVDTPPEEPAANEEIPEAEPAPEPLTAEPEVVAAKPEPAELRGVSAPASTTLTDGVYDEIRRLRSKVADS